MKRKVKQLEKQADLLILKALLEKARQAEQKRVLMLKQAKKAIDALLRY